MFFCFISPYLTKITVLISLFFVNAVESRRKAEHELGEEAMSCVFARIWISSFVSGCVLCLFYPLLFASCRHVSGFSLHQRRSHQWFLLFGVNIPNVSLFIYCISAVNERFSRGCVKHAAIWESRYRSLRTARKEDVEHNTFIRLCLSPAFP